MESTVKQDAVLKQTICLEDEKEFHIQSNDFFRPDLKQIGTSVSDIRDYFMSKEFIPTTLMWTEFEDLKDRLREIQQNDMLSGFPLGTKSKMLAFLSDSLATSLNFEAPPKPKGVKWDIIVFYTDNPAVLLTITGGYKNTDDKENVQIYNASVLKGLTACLSKYLDVSFQPIFGVLDITDIKENEQFTACIRRFVDLSRKLVSTDTLSMNQNKYEKVMTGYWASVAECKSILQKDTDNECEFLRFLTKEQCITLVENINSKRVNVTCQPGSGATTLMVEVAQRLSRQGKTLLVLQFEKDILTHCSRPLEFETICVSELHQVDLSPYYHFVCENVQMKQPHDGKLWTFSTAFYDTSTHHAEHLKKNNFGNFGEAEDLKMTPLSKEGTHDLSEKFEEQTETSAGDKDVYIDALKHQISKLTAKLKRQKEGKMKYKPGTYSMSQSHQVHPRDMKEEKEDQADYPVIGVKSECANPEQLSDSDKKFWMKDDPAQSEIKPLLYNPPLMTDVKAKQEPKTLGLLDAASVADGKGFNIYGVTIKEEPVEITGDGKNEAFGSSEDIEQHASLNIPEREIPVDSSDADEDSSTSRDDDYLCPLCPATCASETEIKQHFLAKHLTQGESSTPVPHEDTPSDVAVAGPSHRPDSPPVPTYYAPHVDTPSDVAVAGPSHCPGSPPVPTYTAPHKDTPSDVAVAGPSHRPDSPPVPTGPRGMKRIKVTYLECPKCPKRFKTERGCERHIRSVHPVRVVRAHEGPVLSTSFDESGDPFYLVGEPESLRPVSCPAMTLDTNRVNRMFHVSEDGLELESTKRRGQSQGDIGGFSVYRGTCSRLPIPLPPSPSTLTTPRYWETHTRVRVERVVWPTLLEMGLCEEGVVDTDELVSYQTRNSWAVWVGVCPTHWPGLCTKVYREGKQVGECCTNTMSNTPGTTAVLHYGVVLDVGRGRLAFLDLDRGIVLSSFNVQFTEALRPMFSVCTSPSRYTVTMRLVSGAEITMTDTKKDLICQALSTT